MQTTVGASLVCPGLTPSLCLLSPVKYGLLYVEASARLLTLLFYQCFTWKHIVTPFCKLTFINMARQQFVLNWNTSGKTGIYSQNENPGTANIGIYEMLSWKSSLETNEIYMKRRGYRDLRIVMQFCSKRPTVPLSPVNSTELQYSGERVSFVFIIERLPCWVCCCRGSVVPL